MVPAALRRDASSEGLQPLRLARDWRPVIDLIQTAFGDKLDAEARRMLRGMRPPPLIGPLIGLLDSLALPGEGLMPGFVWRADGRVVGTASVRRMSALNNGWLISNVAVHPDWQGRGIGRALLEASLDFAQDCGASWVVLQVRDDNPVARHLYESIGFHTLGQVTRWRRPASLRNPDLALSGGRVPLPGLRPARWTDGATLSRIARRLTTYDMFWPEGANRHLYRINPLTHLANRLQGIRRQWWLLPSRKGAGSGRRVTRAAVGIEQDPRNPWHRLRLLIPHESQGQALAAGLIAHALAQLSDAPTKPVEIEYPAANSAVPTALADAAFERLYAFIHMRFDP